MTTDPTDLIAQADALGRAPLWDGDKASCAWCGDGAPGKLCIDQQPVCEDCRTIAYERAMQASLAALRDALAAALTRQAETENALTAAARDRDRLAAAIDAVTDAATPTDERDGPVGVFVPAAAWLAFERAALTGGMQP